MRTSKLSLLVLKFKSQTVVSRKNSEYFLHGKSVTSMRAMCPKFTKVNFLRKLRKLSKKPSKYCCMSYSLATAKEDRPTLPTFSWHYTLWSIGVGRVPDYPTTRPKKSLPEGTRYPIFSTFWYPKLPDTRVWYPRVPEKN